MRPLLLLAAVFAAGCASWQRHGVSLLPPAKLRVAVPVPRFAVRIRRLRDVMSVPKGAEAGTPQEIARSTEALAAAMQRSFEVRLSSSYFFTPVPTSAAHDATLEVTVLGYGRIKRSWVWLLLGSGVVEATSQSVIVIEATGSAPAAMAVGAEEAAQELAEDVGGVFLFDRYFTPVVLKAELVSAKDGKVLWRRWALGTRDRKAFKKLPPAERAKKEERLRIVFRDARDALVRKLEKTALRNEPAPGA
ncbi:MAG: hypothetical protein KGL53_00285 [Elusimicrobia bacterium]|nr:hypothetical protein [Elusimicrobiota bacterium]